MDMQVDISELLAFARRCQGAEAVIRDEMVGAGTRAANVVERGAERVVKTDTHRLQQSIGHQIVPTLGGVVARIGSGLPYAEPVETGRRAGAAMPPRGALLGWLRRHGIPESAEFVVRRAITRRGIPPAPYLSRALAEHEREVRRAFGQVPRRVAKRLGFG